MTFDIFSRLSDEQEEWAERKLIEFKVDHLRCGIDIMNVQEIMNPGEVTPVPDAPPHVIGAADHRTMAVPVIDMRRRFGMSPVLSKQSKWIVVNMSGLETALLVDSVQGVMTVSKKMERERHPLMSDSSKGWVQRVYGDADGIIFELAVNMIAQNKPLAIEDKMLTEPKSSETQ